MAEPGFGWDRSQLLLGVSAPVSPCLGAPGPTSKLEPWTASHCRWHLHGQGVVKPEAAWVFDILLPCTQAHCLGCWCLSRRADRSSLRTSLSLFQRPVHSSYIMPNIFRVSTEAEKKQLTRNSKAQIRRMGCL